jgi:predicted dehydrogenase
MYRHHPQWLKAKELVNGGRIGTLQTIQAFFAYRNLDSENIRNLLETGGGGLMDIGCYCISLSRFLFSAEPRRVCGNIEIDPQFQTDRLASGILEFDQGTATFTCGTQLSPYQRVNIFGTQGRIEIEIPFNAPSERPCRMLCEDGDGVHPMELPACDQYRIQGDLFARAIINNTPVPTPLADGVANMAVVDGLKTSAATQSWVAI